MADPATFDRETVRRAAERFPVPTPTDEDVAAAAAGDLAAAAARYADRAAPAVRAVDVSPGDDDYNAFRHRFELGGDDGPLECRVGVKDNFGLAGVPMACGSEPLADAQSTRDAAVVARLLAAGATLVGKTHMDEFAYGATSETNAFGPVRNPAAPDHVAGGSSSGSAAAVAADLCDVALGSDTGGSVRIPASFCGVVGFKPTWGTVSRAGMVDLAPSFDHVGVLAGGVDDAARTFAAVADAGATALEPGDSVDPADLDGATLGVLAEGFGDHVDAGVADAVRSTVADLETAGVETREVSVPTFTDGADVWYVVTDAELAASMAAGGQSVGRRGEHDPAWRAELAAALAAGSGFGSTLREKTAAGAALLTERPSWYAAAQNDRADLARAMDAALVDVDALVLPTMPTTAPPVGRGAYATDVPLAVNTRPANLAGTPAVSLPAGTHDGLPVGLQLVAPRGADDALLSLAAAVESA
jgi:Asp-tRNA(Asn)/Glu-tRNA(Gln) amidotransferase A subunit family amidase